MTSSGTGRTVRRPGRTHRRTAGTRPVYGPDVQADRSAADGHGPRVNGAVNGANPAGAISDDAWADVTRNVVTRSRVGIVIENYSGNVTTHPASQIAENIVGVSSAADSTTAALTQTRSAVDELNSMAAGLRTTVSRFTF